MGHCDIDAGKLQEGVDVFVHCQQHLYSHKNEYEAKTVFQELEIFCYCCECKVHGAETEDGKDVTRKHNEGVATHGEYSRNAVNGKGYIGSLYDNQRHK